MQLVSATLATRNQIFSSLNQRQPGTEPPHSSRKPCNNYSRIIQESVQELFKGNPEHASSQALTKTEAVSKALEGRKLTIEEIADYNGTSVDFVLEVQRQISIN